MQSPLERYQTMVEYRAGRRPLTSGSAASFASEDAGRWHCLRGWDQRAKSAKLQRGHLTRDGISSDQAKSEGFFATSHENWLCRHRTHALWIHSAEFDASNIIKCHHAAWSQGLSVECDMVCGPQKHIGTQIDDTTAFKRWGAILDQHTSTLQKV